MPVQTTELVHIEQTIMEYLNGEVIAFSSKEIAMAIGYSWSVVRKYLKILYDGGKLQRGKKRGFNKTFYYYVG